MGESTARSAPRRPNEATTSDPTTADPPDLYDRVPIEKIKFATVLNGGVSLAVWMGGATHELNRLMRSSPGRPDGPSTTAGTPLQAASSEAYTPILTFARSSAQADVISGTSAGGINGAALALARANPAADLSVLRDLWAQHGNMTALLRPPFQGDPASLLRGDEYFLPRLAEAFQQLATGEGPEKAVFTAPGDTGHELDLTICTTLLRGVPSVTVDDLGQTIPDTASEGRFVFRGTVGGPAPGSTPGNDFAPGPRLLDTARAMALATRSSASFPFAFEPSFIPAIGLPPDLAVATADVHQAQAAKAREAQRTRAADRTDPVGELRVDLGRHAQWRTAHDGQGIQLDRSRYVVDGGVLDNTPTVPALEAINRITTDGPHRRLMLLVIPIMPMGSPDPPDVLGQPPTLLETSLQLLNVFRAQGRRNHVDRVLEHNQIAASWRGGRRDVLSSIGSDTALLALIQAAYPQFRTLHTRKSAHSLADAAPAHAGWSLGLVRRNVENAQRRWADDHDQNLPYLPRCPWGTPADGMTSVTLAADLLGAHGWPWGVNLALDVADSVAGLLDDALRVATSEQARTLGAARATVSRARTAMLRAQQDLDAPWSADPTLQSILPDEAYWQLRLAAYATAMGINDPQAGSPADPQAGELLVRQLRTDPDADPRLSADGFADAVRRALTAAGTLGTGRTLRDAVHEVVTALANVSDSLRVMTDDGVSGPAADPELSAWSWLLAFPQDRPLDLSTRDSGLDERRELLLSRLLALEVPTWLVADTQRSGTLSPVELVHFNTQTQNAFATQSLRSTDKIAGITLGHFGGFLKRSWRVNDWIWGRLDVASVLCRVILTPDRLWRMALIWGSNRPATPSGATNLATNLATDLVTNLVTDLFGHELEPPACPRPLIDHRDAAVREVTAILLAGLTGTPLPHDASLSNLQALAAYGLQLQIICEELPALAQAVLADRFEGANPRSNGELFLARNRELLTSLNAAPDPRKVPLPQRFAALRAFDEAGIGRESLSEEESSDQFIRTASTALAVSATVVDSDRLGLPITKPITRVLRGISLLPYWLVNGLTRGGPLARFLGQLTLSGGALLLAISLFGVLPPWLAGPGALVGLGALLAAFGVGALRSGSLLHGTALLGLFPPLVAHAAQSILDDRTARDVSSGVRESGGVVLVVLAVTMGLALLGSLRSPLVSPYALILNAFSADARRVSGTAGEAARPEWTPGVARTWRRAARLRFLVRLAAVGATAWAGWRLGPRVGPVLAGWPNNSPWFWPACLGGAAGCTAVGAWTAHHAGNALRLWNPYPPPGEPPDAAGRRPPGPQVGHGGLPPGPVRLQRLSHPVGLAVTWAVVYGSGYLLAALGVGRWLRAAPSLRSTWWIWTALVTATAFGICLTLVVPLVLPRRTRAGLERRLAKDADLVSALTRAKQDPTGEDGERVLVAALRRSGFSYRHLLDPPPAVGTDHPQRLTRNGWQLLYALVKGDDVRPPAGLPNSWHVLGCAVALSLLFDPAVSTVPGWVNRQDPAATRVLAVTLGLLTLALAWFEGTSAGNATRSPRWPGVWLGIPTALAGLTASVALGATLGPAGAVAAVTGIPLLHRTAAYLGRLRAWDRRRPVT